MSKKYDIQYYLDRDARKEMIQRATRVIQQLMQEREMSDIKICDWCGTLFQVRVNSKAGQYKAPMAGYLCHHCAREREKLAMPYSSSLIGSLSLKSQMEKILDDINNLIKCMQDHEPGYR